MIDQILNEELTERAVLVGLISEQQNEAKANEYLDELAFLADTAGAVTVKTIPTRAHTWARGSSRRYAHISRTTT